MSNEVAVRSQSTAVTAGGAFASIENFKDAQRIATVFTKSMFAPKEYQGEAGLGNVVIAMEMANRMGTNPLAVMQNLYVVHGKPAWSSQFLISCINGCGRFSPLRYKLTGAPGEPDRTCVAWAKDLSDGEVLESPEVSIQMARDEGWATKPGSKWKNMPDLMLRYRAATFFARLYAPELTMGMQTAEEIKDITSDVAVSSSPVMGNLSVSINDGIAAEVEKPEVEKIKPDRKEKAKVQPEPEPESQPEEVEEAVIEEIEEVEEVEEGGPFAAPKKSK